MQGVNNLINYFLNRIEMSYIFIRI